MAKSNVPSRPIAARDGPENPDGRRVATTTEVQRLMKRCQVGVGGRHALDEAHSIMADCYGTLGALLAERSPSKADLRRGVERLQQLLVRVIDMADQTGGEVWFGSPEGKRLEQDIVSALQDPNWWQE